MKRDYTRIIREEINRLIFEAVNVSSLSKYVQPLKKCSSNISNIGGTNNNEIDIFLKDMCTYLIQIIGGINRCVNANSLNEGLQDYGIEYPAELGGNFLNDFEHGFYQGADWVRRKFGGSDGGSSGYGNAKGNINPNNVPSVKLADSLRKLTQYSNRYRNLYGKYSNILAKYNMIFVDTFNQINLLEREYTTLTTNAQGQNP